MEDMARLALVEQSMRDIDKFSKLLHELMRLITNILDNPHDYQLRTLKSNILKDFYMYEAFTQYLRYVGFQSTADSFMYPNNLTLSNLRMAQVAIERKISICCGSIDQAKAPEINQPKVKNIIIQPAKILTTTNLFLLKVQDLFNMMLQYEDPNLLEYARSKIPIATLQLKALDRVREQQKKIKTGEIKAQDLPFDIALLMELMGWFKHQFFSWVDRPQCECGGATKPAGTASQRAKGEICRVELYSCSVCNQRVTFPRYNNPRTLLEWRRGRCGEWANCFTLLCRSLGYDVRYVYDVTDHVWCEVFDYDSNTWLHLDCCEGTLNTPLMYSHGWGKRLSYVIAVSRDDLQDVTWRYTQHHIEVLKRRNECTESDLVDCIVNLRFHRQRQLSEARRQYLAKRTAQELVQLMKERKPEEYESHGRVSGAAEWRKERGELGPAEPYTFRLSERGHYIIRYNCARDRYKVSRDAIELEPILSWASGAHRISGVFRKVEPDWKQAYLAREEGASVGEVSWQLSASSGLKCSHLSVKLISKLYEDAKISWTVAFDDGQPVEADLGETPIEFKRSFSRVTVSACLSGGSGLVAWQHAQLFRQPLDADTPAFVVKITVD